MPSIAMQASDGRDLGVVSTEMFAAEWATLAPDVHGRGEFLSQPIVGREWLIAEIDDFCREHDSGYLILEGDSGMGKTTFAASFAAQRQCAAHFTQSDEDARVTAVAARSLGAQLIAAWKLTDLLTSNGRLLGNAGTPRWLASVIQAASRQRDAKAPGTAIILVVDALDAAAGHHEGHMPLGLPERLPERVYVVATTRTGGLQYAPPGGRRYLDGANYNNVADLRRYLARSAAEGRIAYALESAGIKPKRFIDLLVDRSLGVWIYVHYVLEALRLDPRTAATLPELPRGLEAWYHNNLAPLCKGPEGLGLYVPLLAALAATAEPADARTLASFAGLKDWSDAQRALDHTLRPYCSVRRAPRQERRYSVKHPSLTEYISGNGYRAPADGNGPELVFPLETVTGLRERLALACRDAHRRICDRYLTAWGSLDQHLPVLDAEPGRGQMDGGYALRWLTVHLLAADREDDLHRLLACSPAGPNTWFMAHEAVGDVPGYLRDVARARDSAQRLGTQLRYALVEASIASLSTTLPPALASSLITSPDWSPARVFSYIELMADERRQALALAAIAESLPPRLHAQALAVAVQCQRHNNRATALEALIPQLHEDLLSHAVDAVLDIFKHDPDASLRPLTALASRLDRAFLRELPGRAGTQIPERDRATTSADSADSYWEESPLHGCIWAVTALFQAEDRSQGARDALAVASNFAGRWPTHLLMAALIPHLPPDVFDEALSVLQARFGAHEEILISLAEHAPADHLGDVLEYASGKYLSTHDFFQRIGPRLSAEHLPAALRLCQELNFDVHKALAFKELARLLDAGQAWALLAPREGLSPPRLDNTNDPRDHRPSFPASGQAPPPGKLQGNYSYGFAVAEFLGIREKKYEHLVVGYLLEQIDPDIACAVAADLVVPRIQDSSAYTGTGPDLFDQRHYFASTARYLPSDLRSKVLEKICLVMAFSCSDAEKEAPFLARFAPFSAEDVAQILSVLERAEPITWWPESGLMAADLLAPLASEDALEAIRRQIMAFPIEKECFTALAEFGRLQPEAVRGATAERGLALAAGVKNPRAKGRAAAALVPLLVREDLVAKAVDIVFSLDPWASVGAIDGLADVLPSPLLSAAADKIRMHTFADPGRHIPAILARLVAIGRQDVLDDLLPGAGDHEEIARLAPLLSVPQIDRIWQKANPQYRTQDETEGLAVLVSQLPLRERTARVDEILEHYAPKYADQRDARILGLLARSASTPHLTQVLHDYLVHAPEVWNAKILAHLAPGLPDSLIQDAYRYALSDERSSCRALAQLAVRLSGPLLTEAIAHVCQGRHREPHDLALALTALARQIPPDHEDRDAALSTALEAAAYWPDAMAGLIPVLPEELRSRAIETAITELCHRLGTRQGSSPENHEELCAVLNVLRGSEFQQLYTELRLRVQETRALAGALVTVFRQAETAAPSSFPEDSQPIYVDWPGGCDRARLMNLLGATAWLVKRNGRYCAVNEVIDAIFDVVSWWP